MGEIILTCGHKIENFKENINYFNIAIKAHDREGNKAIDYITVCLLCKQSYEINEEILWTEEDENLYLGYIQRESTVEDLFAPIDQNLIAAFLLGHEESNSKEKYDLAQFLLDYQRWMQLKEQYEEDEHCGDCTKQSMRCMRCYVDEYKEKADKVIEMIFRSYDLDEDLIKNILYKAYQEINYGK